MFDDNASEIKIGKVDGLSKKERKILNKVLLKAKPFFAQTIEFENDKEYLGIMYDLIDLNAVVIIKEGNRMQIAANSRLVQVAPDTYRIDNPTLQ